MPPMNRLVSVEQVDPSQLVGRHYSRVLATLGYEQRAVFASSELKPSGADRVAWSFPERQVLAFDTNRQWYEDCGFRLPTIDDDTADGWLKAWVEEAAGKAEERCRVWCDISSMSRRRLACIVAAAMNARLKARTTVDFVYSLAEWSHPVVESEPIVRAGAVHPFFAGWSPQPVLPVIAIIGLGYEPDKAVGAYEYLEAASVWTFAPEGGDARYRRDMLRANSSLLQKVPIAQRVTYPVKQPGACFRSVEGVAYGCGEAGRPVLLPFGPKMFALCSLLVSCLHRDVPVWRITSEQHGDPVDRRPSGDIVALRAMFEPAEGGSPNFVDTVA